MLRAAAIGTIATLLGLQASAQEPKPEDVMEALPEHLIYLYSTHKEDSPTDALKQLYASRRRWEPGRILRVCLFGGNDVVATLIREAGAEWNQYSSVKLDFGPPGAWYNCLAPQRGYFQIRIGFSSRGYWSALGNDSETRFDPLSPSMNFEGFNFLYSPSRMQAGEAPSKAHPYHIGTIKHEFGHALGLLHEHQNPTLDCYKELKWTGPGNVYQYFAGPPNFWTADQVQRNLGFIGQTDPDYVAGAADPKSVMMYSLPSAVFIKGSASPCFVSPNNAISAKDRQIVARIYPAGAPSNVASDVDVRGAPVRVLAPVASPVEVADAKLRIIADLESDDVYTRRDARARLADLLGKLPQADVTDLVRRSASASYRQQLGVAVAIANAPAELELSSESKKILANRAKAAKDPTLRGQLELGTRRQLDLGTQRRLDLKAQRQFGAQQQR
jgi:hypothetical protein